MKIRKIHIKRYKSLWDLTLEDIGDLTTLIGRNSSGKSNILEALNLFFSEFDPEIEKNAVFNEYMWFKRNTKEPIEFIVTIELENEFKEIITKEISNVFGLEKIGNNLTICRQIVSPEPNTALWRTTYVKVNDTFLIEDGKLTKKTVKPAKPDLHQNLLQNLSKVIKAKFKLIPTTRNESRPINLWDRTSIIPPDTQNQLINLHESTNRPDEEKWSEFIEFLEEVPSLAGKMDFIRREIHIKEPGIRFPIALIGGGDQEILTLIPPLIEESTIVGIEEPETHLHSKLARDFFNILKKASENCQILITTHSPVFVDKADLGSTWIVRMENNKTKAIRIKEEGDLNNIFFELGYKPSDVLFADKILLVEGWTEKEVLPILAQKLGYNLLKEGISIFPTRGKEQGKYHLKMWAEITKNTQVPIFMLLDKNAKTEKEKILEERLTDEDHVHLWSKGDMEDYYPSEILSSAAIEVIENEYEIKLTDDDKEK
uniref:DNA replication and repair protein RecF n=1 Tax=Candidatus Methanophaga sp. ANME-1 ERB7 TaxID=2759913 RepID=A0A7G9Z906_9EURY|nr:DNA replication and repair protein RecF [Methanosarcinales archaeon ANME-1 ERB7]